jgi:hypothetical protein
MKARQQPEKRMKKMRVTQIVLLADICSHLALAAAEDPLDRWHQLNPDVDLYGLRDVRFGNGYWVAITSGGVGGPAYILGSVDGTNWVRNYRAPEGYAMHSLKFGGTRWIATARDGSVETSKDGVAWSPIAGLHLGQISYGNGRWLGIGTNGHAFFRSADGLIWLEAPSAIGFPEWGDSTLAFGDGQWLAVGLGSGRELIASTDAETWTARPLPEEIRRVNPDDHVIYLSLAFGNGKWLLQYPSCTTSGINCTNVLWDLSVVTSTDASNWTPHYTSWNFGPATLTLADGRLTVLHGPVGSLLQSDPLLAIELLGAHQFSVRRALGISVLIESSDDLRRWQTQGVLPRGSPLNRSPTHNPNTSPSASIAFALHEVLNHTLDQNQ